MSTEVQEAINMEGSAAAEPSMFLDRHSGRGDRMFHGVAMGFASALPILAVAILVVLGIASALCMKSMGWGFLVSQEWDPVKENFGAAAFAYGTILSSFLALLIAGPLGIAIALTITEFAPIKFRSAAAFLVEMLAAVPSVIYGLWGMFVLAPLMRVYVNPILVKCIGKPFFDGAGTGLCMLTAGVVVAIMILPTVMAICREVFDSVPVALRESALALGATRWESTTLSVLAPSKAGIVGALILGMGRALGETMAVTMVIGNRALISPNLLGPSDSLASAIANQFTEATSSMHLSALAELGFLLFFITMALNMAARLLVWATATRMGGS
jgi:phosphate transport system permease protein